MTDLPYLPIMWPEGSGEVLGGAGEGCSLHFCGRAGGTAQEIGAGHLERDETDSHGSHLRSAPRHGSLVDGPLPQRRRSSAGQKTPGSPHTAKRSRKLAQESGIEFRWLPVACPELNPVEGIWRNLKGKALANRPILWMEELMERACGYIQSLSPVERLRKAGVLSGNLWLAN